MKPWAILWWLRGQQQQYPEMGHGLTTCLSPCISILWERNCPRSPPVLWAIPHNTVPTSSLPSNVCWKIYGIKLGATAPSSFLPSVTLWSVTKSSTLWWTKITIFFLEPSSRGILVSSTNLTTMLAVFLTFAEKSQTFNTENVQP